MMFWGGIMYKNYSPEIDKEIQDRGETLCKVLMVNKKGFSMSPFRKPLMQSKEFHDRFLEEKKNGVGHIYRHGDVITFIYRGGMLGHKSIKESQVTIEKLINWCEENKVKNVLLPLNTFASDGLTLKHMDLLMSSVDTGYVNLYVS